MLVLWNRCWRPLSEARIITLKKQTIPAGDVYENTAFKPGFEIVNQILNQVVESQRFTSLWNRYLQWLSDIKLIQTSVFSASYPRINPCFTAWKQLGVWNCHATCGHRKTTICTSIVHAFYRSIKSLWSSIYDEIELSHLAFNFVLTSIEQPMKLEIRICSLWLIP